MDYEIIFYHSGRTAETEKLLENRLSEFGLQRINTSAATEPSELPDMLSPALKRCQLVFITGGIDGSRQSTENLLSSVLSSSGGEISSERLIDDSGNTAYLLRAEKQSIVLLPDDTDVIDHMLEKKIIPELQKVYSLKRQENEKPPIEEITNELDRQLAAMPRKPIGIVNADSYKTNKAEQRMKVIAAVLAAAAAVQALLALIFLLI